MSKLENKLSRMEKLHENAAKVIASDIDLKSQPVLLYALKGAPGSGKTTMLRNIKSLIVEKNEKKIKENGIVFYSNKKDLGSSFDIFLKGHSIPKTEIGKIEKFIFLIDDLDRHFDKDYEIFFRYLLECAYDFDVVVIATTKITQPSIDLNYNYKDENSQLYEASEAMKSFEYSTIEPNWDEYHDVVTEIVENVLDSQNKSEYDKGQFLTTSILKFCGPYPPALKYVLFHLALGLWEIDKIEELALCNENEKIPTEILDDGLEYVYFSALDWVYQEFHSFKCGIDQNEDLSEVNKKYLSDACLIWGRKSKVARSIKDFPFEKSPHLFQVAFNNWVMVKKRTNFIQGEVLAPKLPSDPAARKSISAIGNGDAVGGGKLMVKVGEQEVDEIELSRLEWMVFAKLVADKAVEVKALWEQLANEVEFQGLSNGEAKIRSALSRIIEKVEEKKCDWILQNLPRRGYLLRLTQPEPNHA